MSDPLIPCGADGYQYTISTHQFGPYPDFTRLEVEATAHSLVLVSGRKGVVQLAAETLQRF